MDQAINLAKSSDSIILILIVILAIILVPVAKALSKINLDRRKYDIEREGRIIKVVEKNTEVNTALKTLIENEQKYCAECKQEQRGLFKKLFDNQEIANVKLAEISTHLERR
jgi:hypothetical protein